MTTAILPEAVPAPAVPTPAESVLTLRSLSPSRASDFKTCPLLYRFRSVDRLPQRPTLAATRGTVVHAVLERLFDLPAAERTPAAAASMVEPAWRELLADQPELGELFAAEPEAEGPWLDSARDLLAGYFSLEDPMRLEPAEREQLVEAELDGGLLLRGYVDRLDVAPTGEVRVVDYKTGRSPDERYEASVLFQLKFYALVLWRSRGQVPRQLRLLYLGDRDALTYCPDEAELARFERTLVAIGAAISKALATGDFRPRPSRLCDWCDHQALCPAFGGTPPAWPPAAPAGNGAPPSR